MILSRRSALFGLLAAPAIIRTPGLLMTVKPFVVPDLVKIVVTVDTATNSLVWAEVDMQGCLKRLVIPVSPVLYNSEGYARIMDIAKRIS